MYYECKVSRSNTFKSMYNTNTSRLESSQDSLLRLVSGTIRLRFDDYPWFCTIH